jgi:hypothetical protein
MLVVLVATVMGCSAPSDQKRIYADLRDLRGVAAESQLLLGLAARGGMTAAFVDEQREFLAEQQRDCVRELEGEAADPSLGSLRVRAQQAGRRLAGRLATAQDPHDLDASVAELAALAEEARP